MEATWYKGLITGVIVGGLIAGFGFFLVSPRPVQVKWLRLDIIQGDIQAVRLGEDGKFIPLGNIQ